MQHYLVHVWLCFGLVCSSALAFGQTGQIPQIPAFLPMMTAVPVTQAQPIDGIWTIASLGKRIRIEGGRAYAVDPWVHMFVLKIQPGMVVIKDIRGTGHGSYTGMDLPLMGTWNARVGVGGALDVQVASMIPVRYQLMPMQLDNPSWFQETVNLDSVPSGPPPATYLQPQPQPQPVSGNPTAPPVAASAPEPAPAQSVSCREVVYREDTDDYQCVQ